jgi:hypothetical protein
MFCFRGKLYFHDAGVRPRTHFANCSTEPDICGRAPQRFQQRMVFAYIERVVLPSTARKKIRRGVATEAAERPAPENMCVRRKCKQARTLTACTRIYSGDVNERQITHRIFVPEGPASRPRHRTDPVAHGPVTLASVSAVALDVRGPFAGSRYQICCQDRHGYCHSRCAGVLRGDASDVHGVSWRVGFDFGELLGRGRWV